MNSSPRQLAMYLAASTAFLIAAASIAINFTALSQRIELIIGISLIGFIFIFWIIYNNLSIFINKKLNPIYKTIYNANLQELPNSNGNGDTILRVQNDVVTWAKSKTNEIDELKKLEKYRKEFLGNVSHELKTPIFNIQGYILTLLDGGLEDSSINRKYLERTEKSINRMISIVQDLESISRLESGELKLRYTKFDLKELFLEVFELQEIFAKERKVKLLFDTNYDKPILVRADRDRILEVANNLVINSIKYGKEKGKTVISFLEMGDHLFIEIADTGIGIADYDLNRIFERFYRTDKSRSRDVGGTGLGLSIVKHIIEAHQQTINVRSTLGVGTSFTFTLEKFLK